MPTFLPRSLEEFKKAAAESGMEQAVPDFVFVTGDSYVDHPSFAPALLGKLLWVNGFSVGIIDRPNLNRPDAMGVFSEPRLGFLVSSGCVDSMVNNYTVALKKRARDSYAPASKAGRRPDRAVTAYCTAIRQLYGDVPIIIGGLEASLRRLGHYDYWSNSVRESVLLESCADICVYGMGERQILAIANALSSGVNVSDINYVDGTVWRTGDADKIPTDTFFLPDFARIKTDKAIYAKSFKTQYDNMSWQTAKVLCERYRTAYIVQNPPAVPLTRAEMDFVYGLSYVRKPHPTYEDVPSVEEVRFSIISSRGCFGGCAFCALTFHQGRHVESRSHESIIKEALEITEMNDFKGYIHDVGGPTANFRSPSCKKSVTDGHCTSRRCLAPSPCKQLDVDHKEYLDLLRKLRGLPKIKKVFIRSGIRFDYIMADKNEEFMRELVEHHISGQLKVAPEHVSDRVLRHMGKPPNDVYVRFKARYERLNGKLGKKQFLVPYLMSGHPGSGLNEAIELALYLHESGITPEQVQDFYPTPGTVATCMYYTGVDPLTGEKVYVARTAHEKAMQRALIQYKNPKNRQLVIQALMQAGRRDLIQKLLRGRF